jgi:hypothetical protein
VVVDGVLEEAGEGAKLHRWRGRAARRVGSRRLRKGRMAPIGAPVWRSGDIEVYLPEKITRQATARSDGHSSGIPASRRPAK